MIDGRDDLPIKQQAKLLKLARSSVYYQPVPLPASDLKLMHRIDRLHLAHPFAGSRMLRDLLKAEGFKVGRCHVRTLMKRMGIEALYRRPRTSKPGAGHRIYPYLLANRQIEHANEVWATDVTYIPMARGFVYLVAIMDWHSRRVLSWRLSNTLTTDFCVEALEEALRRDGQPQISTPIKAANSPATSSPGSSRTEASRSAWMAKAPGETMYLLNDFGGP